MMNVITKVPKKLLIVVMVSIVSSFFILVWSRVAHTYLEDDTLWFLPLVTFLAHESSVSQFLNYIHTSTSELTLFDSAYFLLGKWLFGYQFWKLTCVSLLIHTVNAFLIWQLLARVYQCLAVTAVSASLIYLSYYAHCHAYLWPMGAHHLITVCLILCFIYSFEIIEQNISFGQKPRNFQWGIIVAFSIFASLLRLSVLIIPITLIGRIIFCATSMHEARQQYRRWIPILGILFFYQTMMVFTDNCGDVLSSFLKPFGLLGLGWIEIFLTALMAIALGLWMIDCFLSYKVTREIKSQHFKGMVLPAWVSIGVSTLTSLLLFNWIFAYPLAMHCDTAGRWQIIPMIQPLWMGVILWGVTSLMLIRFVEYCYQFNRRMMVFMVWVLGVVIFLGFIPKNIPSRYLIYASPFMSIMLSCLFFEIMPRQSKLFSRIPVTFIFLGIVIIMFFNVFAVHIRSYRTFLADYHWSYDFIKTSHLIHNDLVARGVNIHTTNIIVNHVEPIPYVNGWQHTFLKNINFDTTNPFKYTFYAIAGIPKDLSINTPCYQGAECFDTKDFMNVPFANNLLNDIGWPKNDVDGKAQALSSIYGKSYDGDEKINVIDTALYQESLSFESAKDRLTPQGILVEKYRGYDFYYLTHYYFAVKNDQPFYLPSFKIAISSKHLVSQYKYQLRRMVDQDPDALSSYKKVAVEHYVGLNKNRSIQYKACLMGIPLAGFQFDIKTENGYTGELTLQTPRLIEKISSGRVGLIWRTRIDQHTLLPIEAEYSTAYKQRQHKPGKKIKYQSDQNFLEGVGYSADVFSPNRDMVSLMLWLMLRRYSEGEQIHTYFNYSKMFFEFNGNVARHNNLILISGIVKDTNLIKSKQAAFSVHIKLMKEDNFYIIKEIRTEGGIFIISVR